MEEFIAQLIRQAGQEVRQRFGRVAATQKTDASDVVTEADTVANQLIVDGIRSKYPAAGFISEELGEERTDASEVWIIDPVDGTLNFSTGTPMFAVMIGLARDGVMELSAIYQPMTDELYLAQRGKGATKNGQRIHCSTKTEWAHSYGCSGAKWTEGRAPIMAKLAAATKDGPFWLSGFGSLGISSMYTADGRRDWYITGGAMLWDYAAPSLLLSEAGCTLTNLKGEPWTLYRDLEMVAANAALHRKLLAILNG